jgi:fucose permease
MSIHPPFPVVVVLNVLSGFASGLMNGSWNSYVGGLDNASTLLGFMHGFFGVGATISPICVGCLLMCIKCRY